MSDKHRYYNGLREAVVFLFLKNGKLLIETRPDKNGDLTDSFFPNGSVEIADEEERNEYLSAALKREIAEEFCGKIKPKSWLWLGEALAKPINVGFTVYFIDNWQGDLPDWTYEDDQPFGKLSWVDIDQVAKIIPYQSAHDIITML